VRSSLLPLGQTIAIDSVAIRKELALVAKKPADTDKMMANM
jgi:hypothetical protein